MENKEKGRIYFVDKFFVPQSSINEFIEKMTYNRAFVAGLSGYLKGDALEKSDGEGNLTIITVVLWENADKLKEAKLAIQTEFKRTGFNPVVFYQRLGILMERDEYGNLREYQENQA
jgi:hypothetical protein